MRADGIASGWSTAQRPVESRGGNVRVHVPDFSRASDFREEQSYELCRPLTPWSPSASCVTRESRIRGAHLSPFSSPSVRSYYPDNRPLLTS